MSFFSVSDLTAGYGGRTVVKEISFELEAGELLGILWANGSGKTTLLESICGNLPHEGRCLLDGTALEGLPPRQLARRCGYIPQRSGIGIDIPVLDVVLMGFNPWLGLLEYPGKAMKERARELLERVGLGGREQENYQTLSQGQKQLCVFARTLAADSNLLLLDEPESALDFAFRYQMLELLRDWLKQGRRGAVVTLHDPVLALNTCDRLLLLQNGENAGILCPARDTPEEMEQALVRIYGPVTLTSCRDRRGREQLVLLFSQGETGTAGEKPLGGN